ncbi:hypothetical protein ABIC09_006849 [Bradyrhizobium sp. S3.12.5]
MRQRELARAIFLEREHQARDRAGHTDAKSGIARLGGIRLAVGSKEYLRRGRCWRGLAIVDRDIFIVLGGMDHHEAAAADIAGTRISHGHRKAGRDGCIDGIATTPQDVGADLRRYLLLRHHHAVLGGDRVHRVERRGDIGPPRILRSRRCKTKRQSGDECEKSPPCRK